MGMEVSVVRFHLAFFFLFQDRSLSSFTHTHTLIYIYIYIGNGGYGGSGGRGGSAGPRKTWYENRRMPDGSTRREKKFGRMTSSGRSGNRGTNGSDGRRGPDGIPGNAAQTTWSVIDQSGNVVEGPSLDRFSPALTFLRFCDDNGDGIFEPGSVITFPMVMWSNLGGLSCPPGSVLQIVAKNNASLLNTSQPVQLGACPISVSNTVQTTGFGAQFTAYDPNQDLSEKPYLRTGHFQTDISMLGRSFFQGCVPISVPIQYPIRMVQFKAPDLLGTLLTFFFVLYHIYTHIHTHIIVCLASLRLTRHIH